MESCGIVPAQTKLMDAGSRCCAQKGIWSRMGSAVRDPGPLCRIDLAAAWKDAEHALDDEPFLLAYLRNCVNFSKVS